MLEALINAFRISDLRRKILYTLGLLVVFRIGSYIPVPGVDAATLREMLDIGGGNVFAFLDLFAGGALGNFALFAMGVNPYITASIIMQLLQVVIPRLEELAKEGIEGRKQIAQYTRYGTVILAIVQAIGLTALARSYGVIASPTFFTLAVIVVNLTAGSLFLTWIGEKISEKGIGNGVSLIIFTGIVARFPSQIGFAIRAVGEGGVSIFSLLLYLVLAVVVIAGVVMVQEGQRRIPVQYARRVVGRRVMGGQSTHIPLRVNQAGVIPVIFASSILTFPLTLGQFVPSLARFTDWLALGGVGYNIVYALLVVFFTYFYTAVTFNPRDVADNMRKYGGFIPGLRPGRPTAEYLDRVLTRITLLGALFLAFIAVLPYLMAGITRLPMQIMSFGGTSLLIMVGVALDTMKQVEAQLLMRHYEGFIR
ncbi:MULTISPECIES: preprotein translocase subunit SecY [Limnochorda]|uniref:preprotein translocase subunit SecY n=1 Tax=Limnochorda TaxID=1676651 RepID=UPI0017A8836A|nr:preprotein translocase subunit SecY [Limnochorda pilosa]MBO2485704.1 preprotein translocase subunit SecY [Bacillota bacterium]MBO2518228.1 preprotein translocase subunit SecY [Bacillota bacterium]NMA71647.1 preprotein translocase subunit SecY [Bacillota bacterium]